MIKKLALACMLVAMAHLSMSADYSLVVHRTSGAQESILLAKKPVVTFSESDLIITTDGSTLAIPRTEVKNMDFTEVSGIGTIETSGDVIEVIDGNTLRITTTGPVAVYDLQGRLISAASVAADGSATTVSLASCPADVYIIAYNNKSIKFTKK